MQNGSWIEALGLVAGSLTTVSFLPQAVKVWRSRSTHDISLLMFSLMLIGTVLWLTYGILLDRPALIFANGSSLSLIAWIGWFKLRYG
jgi:MtN3 and saliva related transmembrane protein